jgi:hypothetical protein
MPLLTCLRVQDTMRQASVHHNQGDTAAAVKHWRFAADQVAKLALMLQVQSDGPRGNVPFWRREIMSMQSEALERYASSLLTCSSRVALLVLARPALTFDSVAHDLYLVKYDVVHGDGSCMLHCGSVHRAANRGRFVKKQAAQPVPAPTQGTQGQKLPGAHGVSVA